MDGSRDGVGRLEYSNGEFYIGGWQNGKKEGIGAECSRDGRVYFGGWKKDRKEGQGLMIIDGIEYKGEWANNKLHGRATVIG